MSIDFNTYNKEEETSFALLRTNPKLTSNLKLVVDSADNIFLSSFKANRVLSKVEYQKFEVSKNGNYANDVARFFKGTPTNERFQTLKKFSDVATYSDYSFQYEDQYNYGANFNSTKLYDEQYKLFAPIWLDRRIPKKFVIYRVNDVDYSQKYSEDILGQNDRILELLENATIIKSFDLSNKSNLGQYLHSHVYDKGAPNSAIEFNFSDSGAITYNGIDTTKGGFASKKDFIEGDFIQQDNLEINTNELITTGFERHGLISSNLINLEFMFDDASAENYKIYRYFGLYVDDIEEGSFKINSVTSDNILRIEPGTVHTVYDVDTAGITHSDMLPRTTELSFPSLSYVDLGGDNLLHVRNRKNSGNLQIPVTSNLHVGEFIKLTNYTRAGETLKALSKKIQNKPFIEIEVVEKPIMNDRIFIADITEFKIQNWNLYSFSLIADDNLPEGTFNGNSFSTQGSFSKIAFAIGKLIERLSAYKVKINQNSVIIEDYAEGNSRKKMSLGVYDLNVSTFLNIAEGSKQNSIPGYTGTMFNDWDLYSTVGGSADGESFLVSLSDLGDVKAGQYIKERNLEKYYLIKEIVKDHENEDTYRVIVSGKFKRPADNILQVYDKLEPTFGKFSAYHFKDFDFDFYSDRNSKLGELLYENVRELDEFNEIDGVEYDPKSKFAGITSVLYQDDVDDLVKATKLDSEYDRLEENKLKETALKSRVVPTIMKYALKNGTNARNKPYVLNVSEAFGTNNMSPDIRIESGRDYDKLNMEHFHFNKIPNNFYEDNKIKDLSSYTSFTTTDGISVSQLMSTEIDYFSLYFNWNGALNVTDEEWVDGPYRKLYTTFDGGTSELEPSTVFRGLRYIYKKRKERAQSVPTAFEKTSEVNSYKFGVTLDYVKGGETNQIRYRVIKNDTFKFICVVLEIDIQDNDIDSLNRALVYELNDMTKDESLINSKLSFEIDLSKSIWPQNQTFDNITVYASDEAEEGGLANFTKEITKNEEGSYSWIYFETPNSFFPYAAMRVVSITNDNSIVVGGTPVKFDPSNGPILGEPVDGQTLDSIPTDTEFIYWKTGSAGWKNILDQIVSYNFAKRFNNFGEITYSTVGNGITRDFALDSEFVLEVQDGVDLIKPSVLDTAPDGDKPRSYQLSSEEIGKVIQQRKDGGYFTALKRMNGEYNPMFRDVIRFTDLYTQQSILIPDEELIGNGEHPYAKLILPYPDGSLGYDAGSGSGDGWGLINNLIESQSDTTNRIWRERLIYDKFKNQGIAFSSFKNVDDKYGYIENMHFHKVNDENSKSLLKLSETTDKLPLYPAIGEIAIDKKDFNVFKSKYADDYFTKAHVGFKSESVHGTLSPVELKSFMASTIMKVKDQYNLTRFTDTLETSLDSLDSIRFNKLNKTAIHWIENESEIIADFYLPKTIYNELLEDGIKNKFSKYVNAENSFGDKSTIEDDLEQYVYSNIVHRFIIDNIDIYGIAGKNLTTSFISVDSPKEMTDGRFVKQTNFDIQGYQNDGLSFRLIYSKKPGFKYHLKLDIKIQA